MLDISFTTDLKGGEITSINYKEKKKLPKMQTQLSYHEERFGESTMFLNGKTQYYKI